MTQSTSSGLSDWVINTAKNNPEGALLLAAGAVLLLRRTGVAAVVGQSELAKKSSDTVRETTAVAKDYASSIAAKATDAARDYANEAQSYALDATNAISSRAADATETARNSLLSTIDRIVKEQPLCVAIAGVAVGAGVAAAFPASELEKSALKPVSGSLNDAVKYVGEEAKEAMSRATDKLKEVAEDRGLTGEGLKKMATDVVSAAAPQSQTRSQGDHNDSP